MPSKTHTYFKNSLPCFIFAGSFKYCYKAESKDEVGYEKQEIKFKHYGFIAQQGFSKRAQKTFI